MCDSRPHIVVIVPRGEVVRNFLYSDTLSLLAENARVTLLTVVHDEEFVTRFMPYCESIIPLTNYDPKETRVVRLLREGVQLAHWRYVWSTALRSRWEYHDWRAREQGKWSYFKRRMRTMLWKPFANAYGVELLSRAEQRISRWLTPTDEFIKLFHLLKPDLVFNGSQVHSEAAIQPVYAANWLGIKTATFVFSWDNMTTQGRILPHYDHYLVWHDKMKSEVLNTYPAVTPEQVTVTGTPQFDFHFNSQFIRSREQFFAEMGLDPRRRFILYTTAMPSDFPEETGHLDAVIGILHDMPAEHRPQLLVRVYAKDTRGTFDGHRERYRNSQDVVFAPTLWKQEWSTPKFEDFYIYNNILYYTTLGINGASTVSLELCMYDKPVINLAFNPPGTNLPWVHRWIRHIEFDHYRPVAESGAVMLAHSVDELRQMIFRGLNDPSSDSVKRRTLIKQMFGDTLDGKSGRRVAECLLRLVHCREHRNNIAD